MPKYKYHKHHCAARVSHMPLPRQLGLFGVEFLFLFCSPKGVFITMSSNFGDSCVRPRNTSPYITETHQNRFRTASIQYTHQTRFGTATILPQSSKLIAVEGSIIISTGCGCQGPTVHLHHQSSNIRESPLSEVVSVRGNHPSLRRRTCAPTSLQPLGCGASFPVSGPLSFPAASAARNPEFELG